ncbi:bifunctional DNA-formamidopyrimidine glycosylase/DNA-(apurinic or apyrimidinic site) lyase [Candidatus Bipolaricaulota bacterium]|nr:bifunctional DNA-formamidopyrimidine glycosylase/DNA-(apurinic or apyrimidinic site) lyase [Candidatus Bipolaricaulota bacterium]
MPELPEVETIVRGLAIVNGARIDKLEVLDPRLELPVQEIVGKRIKRIERRGKYILLHLPEGKSLIIHLRMSGRLGLARSPAEEKHTRLILHLDRGKVYFVNPRRLGTVEYSQNGFPHEIGIDPFDLDFTPQRLEEIVTPSRAPIKPLLMKQGKISGLGNIYATEALWRGRIDPRRAGNTLTAKEVRLLHRAIVTVLQEAIDHMGTTFGEAVSDYRNASGNRGSFQDLLTVYGREGEPCRRCEKTIERIVQTGRSTYYCPKCQR